MTTDAIQSEIERISAELICCEDRQERERLVKKLVTLASERADRIARDRILAIAECALGE